MNTKTLAEGVSEMEQVKNVLKWIFGLTASMFVLGLVVVFIFYPGYFIPLMPVDASTKTEQVETIVNKEEETSNKESVLTEETNQFLRDQAKINARNAEQRQYDTVIIPDATDPVNYTLIIAVHIIEEINGNMVTYYLKDETGVTNIYTTEYVDYIMYGTYSYDLVNDLKEYYPNNIIE